LYGTVILANRLSFFLGFYALIVMGRTPRLVALTEKLLFPDERSVGQSQYGVDADTDTRSHGV